MKVIETERLIVRSFLSKDIELFMAYRNNRDWMQYQGFKCLSRKDYEKVLLIERTFKEGVQLAVVLNGDDKLIGDVYINECDDKVWVGYTISPQYARKGYASEVVLGLIEWIKETMNKDIYAGVLPDNEPSLRLLKKLSFKYVETDDEGEAIYRV